MAERRSIHRKLSLSEDIAALWVEEGGEAVAFFLSLIPHYDRWGCVPASPSTLKAQIIPLSPVQPDQIREWIAWLANRGMLVPVEGPKGDLGLRNPEFEKHQDGGHLNRETPSRYEPQEVTDYYSATRTDHKERGGSRASGNSRKAPPKDPRPKVAPERLRSGSGAAPQKEGVEVKNPSQSKRASSSPETDRPPLGEGVRSGDELDLPEPGISADAAREVRARLVAARRMT